MADNYTQATMTPSVFLTDKQRNLLSCYGARYEPDGEAAGHKVYYVFWENHFNEHPDEMDIEGAISEGVLAEGATLPAIEHFLHEILLNPENKSIEALDVEGCWHCSKLRPGEFGGFALMITRREHAYINTGVLRLKRGKIISPNPIVKAF